MSDLQAIADRYEIEALRGEFTDAVMMRDDDRRIAAATYMKGLGMRNSTARIRPDRGAPSIMLIVALLGAQTHGRANVIAALARQ